MLIPEDIARLVLPTATGRFRTSDGIELHYQSFGDGPAVLFANGTAARYFNAVRQVVAFREAGYRLICWDYRGIGESAMASEGDLSIPRHAHDALALLDHLRVERAIMVGWSMGVQVCLEALHLQPDRALGLVTLFGVSGLLLRTALPAQQAALLHRIFELQARHPAPAILTMKLAAALPALTRRVMSLAHLTRPAVDRQLLALNLRSLAAVDQRVYARSVLAQAEYDGAEVLSTIRCPALVLGAEHDLLAPPWAVRSMADRIAGAEYHQIADGAHFCIFEQPELVMRLVLDFAERCLHPGDRRDARAGAGGTPPHPSERPDGPSADPP